MKIETSEAVRRFNAQTELADLALSGAPFIDTADPYEIMVRLRQAGHTGLADSFRDAGQALGYFPEVCPKSEPRGMNLEQLEMLEDDCQVKDLLVKHGKQTHLIPPPHLSGPFRSHVVWIDGDTLYAVTHFHGYLLPDDNGYRAIRIPVNSNTPADLSAIVNEFIGHGQSGPSLYEDTIEDSIEAN